MRKVRPAVRFGWASLLAACALAPALLVAPGCGSSEPAGDSPSEAGADDVTVVDDGSSSEDATPPDDGSSISDAAGDANACDPDADVVIDCTGKCGPVRDACTGKVKECGGCAPVTAADGGVLEQRVCDLSTNACTKPKVTCADLGAECGTLKNSCGTYLDCPDTNPKGCPAGKECNPDTHTCQDCQQVSCADLGYECGFAWLGCGQDTPSNYTDCGGCAPDADGGTRVCNGVFHVCEPKCTPKTVSQLCTAAKAKSGVECGYISDGCGGIVNCDTAGAGFGCPSGQSCGVRGIANRCDPKVTPDECVAQGKNCGDIVSACTGLKVHCGDCTTGQVCNANGTCGAPCTPKTCADYSAFQCGTFDDGCGATVTCGTCPGGVCEQTTHTCCATKQCATDYANQCGTSLPNGCGQNTDNCACTAGKYCTTDGGPAPVPPAGTTGACCTPLAAGTYTGAGQCGTNLPDGCGHNNVNAACPVGKECVANGTGSPGPAPAPGVIGSCCTRTDSCTTGIDAGACGPVQDSCRPAGTTYQCNRCVAPQTCNANTCCQAAPACPGAGGEGAVCNIVENPVDPGCGSARPCNCVGGRVCWCTDHVCTVADGAGACKTPLTCATGYPNQCGTGLSNGTGGTVNCGCPTGQVCSTSTPGATGTCGCNNPTGQPYTCQNVPGGPGQPGGDACGAFNNGCGGTLNCGCPVGQTCNTAANPNVCCTPTTCPVPALGSACGAVSNGCGSNLSCACPSGTGKENFVCSGGTCQCTPDTCRGRTGPQPDRCGGTLQCGG